ncbi:MAG: 2-phospho-L-lactate transferase [Candidatus Freyarchaeota archaeon]
MIKLISLLTGGTGGLKLLEGFLEILPQDEIAIIVNTGDDIEFHGLHISPDLDSTVYLIAGLLDKEKFWGIKGDTFNCLEMMEKYGLETWFSLGDRDLATHILRTFLLRKGMALSTITKLICKQLGVKARVLPMSDDRVQTYIRTDLGVISFQEFWVKHRGEPDVFGIEYRGAEKANPPPEVIETLTSSDAIIFGPSNPITSIGPILAVRGIKDTIKRLNCKKIAVSPIVGGQAVSGPAAKLMRGLKMEVSPFGVALFYKNLIDTLVFDKRDALLKKAVNSIGIATYITDTLMVTREDTIRLASEIMELIR